MFTQVDGGVRLTLYIQPNAPKSEIVGPYNGALKVKIKAPPIEGQANEELVRFLAKFLDLPKRNIEILKGETGRNKSVLVHGADLQFISSKFSSKT